MSYSQEEKDICKRNYQDKKFAFEKAGLEFVCKNHIEPLLELVPVFLFVSYNAVPGGVLKYGSLQSEDDVDVFSSGVKVLYYVTGDEVIFAKLQKEKKAVTYDPWFESEVFCVLAAIPHELIVKNKNTSKYLKSVLSTTIIK